MFLKNLAIIEKKALAKTRVVTKRQDRGVVSQKNGYVVYIHIKILLTSQLQPLRKICVVS
jgi:hypothetical protein